MNKDLIITAKESATILKRCEGQIQTALNHLERTEQLSNGLRGVIGVQMALAKPHIPHGNSGDGDGFKTWLNDRWPQIEYATANSWMKLGQSLIAAEEKSKSGSDQFFKLLPEKLSQGVFDFERDGAEAASAAKALMAGDSIQDFIGKHTERVRPGGSRQIQFTCPKCHGKNKGFPGRTITCSHQECGARITVKADGPSPQAKVEAIIAEEEELLGHLCASIELWKARPHRDQNNQGLLRRAVDLSVEWHKELERLMKQGRKGK